jgi:hypothetical protein
MQLDRRQFVLLSSTAAFAATPVARLLAQSPATAQAAPPVTPLFADVCPTS